MRSEYLLVLKAAVSVGSLYLVSRSIAWGAVINVLKGAQFQYLFAAIALFWVAQIFSSLRCTFVAQVLGVRLNLSTSIRAHFVGLWFNQVLPTGLGGDFIKMAILKKTLGLRVAVRLVILGRISGFMFLLLMLAITLPLYVKLFPQQQALVSALGIIAFGGVLAIFLGAFVVNSQYKLVAHNTVLLGIIQLFCDIWRFRKGPALWGQLWLSAIVHFNGIITYALLGFALGINVELLIFILIVPIIFLIALIPISFAGWGLREAGAVWLFGLIGINSGSALALSICFGLLLVVAGLPGLFMMLISRFSLLK